MYNYKVDRNENCVLINTDEWLNPDSSLQKFRISGKSVITYFTKALDKHITSKFEEADTLISLNPTIALTKIISEISRDRAYKVDGKNYYDVPVMQIIGIFRDSIIDMEHLEMLYDKILIEKIDSYSNTIVKTVNDNTMLGKVIKTGFKRFDKDWNPQNLTVKKDDIVLIRDNVSTPLTVQGKTYYAVEENSVVGIFESSDINLENLNVINNYIICDEYINEKLFNSSILLTPNIVYDDLDYSDIYNKNVFKVLYVDSKLTCLSKNDIILIDRNLTNYMFFNNKKYFIISNLNDISGKILKEEGLRE